MFAGHEQADPIENKKGYLQTAAEENIIKRSDMTENEMWALFETAKTKDGDIEEQMEWLVTVLSCKSAAGMFRFEDVFSYTLNRSYTSPPLGSRICCSWRLLG